MKQIPRNAIEDCEISEAECCTCGFDPPECIRAGVDNELDPLSALGAIEELHLPLGVEALAHVKRLLG